MQPSASTEPHNGVLLCIDDNPDLLECEKAFLESHGYSVLVARSGARGLELASMHPVDVVIVDYSMPDMNGREFAIEMRRLKPEARIIMLSAAVDLPRQALELVNAFVAKDHLSRELLSAISAVRQ
jgi:CheY-like chemotaxis protein